MSNCGSCLTPLTQKEQNYGDDLGTQVLQKWQNYHGVIWGQKRHCTQLDKANLCQDR